LALAAVDFPARRRLLRVLRRFECGGILIRLPQRRGDESGGRGAGTSVYFRDPDGSLLELIVYDA